MDNNDKKEHLETIKKETAIDPTLDDIEQLLEEYYKNIRNKIKTLTRKK